jgi:ribonuclease HI
LYVAEFWGVLECFKMARWLNFRQVELHVDSMIVVRAINSAGSGSMRGADFLLLQQDAVTIKDRLITTVWLRSFSVIL